MFHGLTTSRSDARYASQTDREGVVWYLPGSAFPLERWVGRPVGTGSQSRVSKGAGTA